jgi:ribosome-associated heat shock protein Hsp15
LASSVAEMRIDRFLWFARIVRSRGDGQAMARGGHLRLSGRTVDKPATAVRIGDILTFAAHGGKVRAIRIEMLPQRRGPPAEARACYAELITGAPASGD